MFIKKYRGFTLVEILVVVAMIAILSSAILVAVSGQREQARRSKVLVEVSGVIQPMMMCWSDGGTVNSSGNICDIDGYGVWPDLEANGWLVNASDFTDSGNWFFQVTDGSSYICCNSTYDRCADMGTDNGCNATTSLD